MPRKKNNLPAKQNRFIATRLMQISLLVDDYLYQKKPMSEKSAVAYINEIATYKDKCYQDARSLQVIEKLTRCMTAIIHEQQELHGTGTEDINAPQDNVNETNVISAPYEPQESYNNLMLSPVYSEIDEDLTQIPQYFEVKNYEELTARYIANDLDINKDYNNQGEIVPLDMKEIETDSTINVQNRDAAGISLGVESVSEVINLCDEDIDELIQNHSGFLHEPEFNIQKAISNLCIRDIDETLTPFSQQCSQSILDNLNTNNITYQPQDTSIMVPPRNYDNVVKTAAIIQKPATEMVSFRHGPTKIVLPTTKQKVHVKDTLNKPVRKYTKKMQKKERVCAKTTAQKNQKRTKRKYTKASEINTKTYTKGNAKKRKPKATNKKLQENKDLTITEKPLPKVYTNRNKPSMEGSQIDINMETPTYQNIQTTESTNTNIMRHDISENAVAPIQNKIKTTYVQDLSWVENLRFVREIQVEEFEPFTDEGFWENWDLPAKLNEDDFNY